MKWFGDRPSPELSTFSYELVRTYFLLEVTVSLSWSFIHKTREKLHASRSLKFDIEPNDVTNSAIDKSNVNLHVSLCHGLIKHSFIFVREFMNIEQKILFE